MQSDHGLASRRVPPSPGRIRHSEENLCVSKGAIERLASHSPDCDEVVVIEEDVNQTRRDPRTLAGSILIGNEVLLFVAKLETRGTFRMIWKPAKNGLKCSLDKFGPVDRLARVWFHQENFRQQSICDMTRGVERQATVG